MAYCRIDNQCHWYIFDSGDTGLNLIFNGGAINVLIPHSAATSLDIDSVCMVLPDPDNLRKALTEWKDKYTQEEE
tara:strand:- start:4782 stop:5006 length:225 start_codon:yes stop_codon:yes gene_type:complete